MFAERARKVLLVASCYNGRQLCRFACSFARMTRGMATTRKSYRKSLGPYTVCPTEADWQLPVSCNGRFHPTHPSVCAGGTDITKQATPEGMARTLRVDVDIAVSLHESVPVPFVCRRAASAMVWDDLLACALPVRFFPISRTVHAGQTASSSARSPTTQSASDVGPARRPASAGGRRSCGPPRRGLRRLGCWSL